METRSIIRLSPAVLLLALLFACSSPDKKTESTGTAETQSADTGQQQTPQQQRAAANQPRDTFVRSAVIPSVSGKVDPNLNYALYLPHQYAGNAHLPALLFFDPHG